MSAQKTESMMIIRRRVGQKVSRMTPDACRAIIAVISERDRPGRGATIEHAEIRELTGGYASQSINFYVLRKLGVRAGIVKL